MSKKVSVKSVIESGIESGKSVKMIMSQIEKKCPDSKADEGHIRYYANAMVRAGTLDQEVAAAKYGCGTRGRKAKTADEKPKAKKANAEKTSVKKVSAKKASAKKSEKTEAEAKPTAKKSTASKKSVSAKGTKATKKRTATSKA